MARSAPGVVLLAVAFFVAVAPGSRAAFPGENGRVVFDAEPNLGAYMFAVPGPSGLYVVEPDGSDVRPLRLGVQGVSWSPGFSGPAWSPDGSKIAYFHWQHHRGSRMEVMNADGSGGRVVVPDSRDGGGQSAWSPDGSLIAFTGRGSPGHDGVWIVGANGEGARLIVGRAEEPAWSPDCSRIAFRVDPSDERELRTIDARGRERPLTAGFEPNWSPDGRHIAFWDYDKGDGRAVVRVIGADGSGERFLAYGSEPAWSPDGREIVFTTERGLSVTPADGGAARALTRRVDEYHSEPDWQPLRTAPVDPALCAAWRDPVESSTPLELSIRPRRALVGRLTRFRLRVTALGEGVHGAVVRFGGARRSTDARGRAVAFRAFRRPGERRLTAVKTGFAPASAAVRIVEQRRSG